MDSDSSPTFPDQNSSSPLDEPVSQDQDQDQDQDQGNEGGISDSDGNESESAITDDSDVEGSDVEGSDIEGSDVEDSDIEDSDIEDSEAAPANQSPISSLNFDESDLESDDGVDDEEYLQKFDRTVRQRFIEEYHPQAQTHNYEEVAAMAKVTRAADGRIVDALHRTIPILTKYEKTRILGQRAAQLNSGAQPLVSVPAGVMQGHVIAELELKAKKLPFIIRRPLPNRGSEYWYVSDLELL